MQKSLVDAFKKLDVSNYPNIHKYSCVADYSLWVSLLAKEKLGLSDLSAPQIQKILTEVFGIPVTTQGVRWALEHTKGRVLRKTTRSGKVFSIMQKGIESILNQFNVLIIEPEKPYEGIRSFQSFLVELKGDIRICDPYIDTKTLDILTLIPSTCKIKLLTSTIQKEKIFRRDYNAYQTQYKNLEIKVLPSARLHDRYIISENAIWFLGQSLNGIGKKETFLVSLGEDLKSVLLSLFKQNWNNSNSF